MTSTCKKKKTKKLNLDTDFTVFTKINSKWITDLNVKCKTIKLLEDNIRENLEDRGFGDDVLDATPKAQSMKEKIDKLDFIKIKNFCSMKDDIKRLKRQTTYQEKIFAKTISDKGLLSKIHKELLKPNNKNTNNLFKTWTKYLDGQITKEDTQMANEHTKRCSASYVIRKLQIKKQ